MRTDTMFSYSLPNFRNLSESDAQQDLKEKHYLNTTLMYKRNYLPCVIMKMSKRFVEIDYIPLTEINIIFISLYELWKLNLQTCDDIANLF